MAESNFVDYVKIYCRSGKGGRGSSHFRREKYIPKGGPDGRRRGARRPCVSSWQPELLDPPASEVRTSYHGNERRRRQCQAQFRKRR